ncbi:MAG: peptide chain release factor-like protein [Chthoniobacterales bacterium]
MERRRRLGIQEADLKESFARSSGPGGQHVNKVSTAVTLKHLPSGLSVTVQDSRSQARNRQLALERLLDALERRTEEAKQKRRSAAAEERRRNSPRPRSLKRKILEGKRQRSQLKKLRAKPID